MLSVCVYGNDIISMELGGIVGISIIQFNMQNMKWSGFWRKVISPVRRIIISFLGGWICSPPFLAPVSGICGSQEAGHCVMSTAE